ncbi:hypothetical protein ABIE66_002077 [Peribacillus sp. B2I2]|uniref:hypothetical protein n=1 Tax=Peribacillus sp. B2I2 TaxID=3156468 RepID=UPI003517C2D3
MVPTYDTLFERVQSYYRIKLGEKEASLLVIGAGGGNEIRHGDHLTQNDHSLELILLKRCLRLLKIK